MKFLDRRKTNYCEGIKVVLEMFFVCLMAKVVGSKASSDVTFDDFCGYV